MIQIRFNLCVVLWSLFWRSFRDEFRGVEVVAYRKLMSLVNCEHISRNYFSFIILTYLNNLVISAKCVYERYHQYIR